MAVKIPIYEDRLTPGGGIQAQARPVEVSDAIGRGMQRVGEAGTQLAGIEMRALAEKIDADAVASVGSRLAEATGFYHQRVTDLSKNVDDNGFVTGADGKPMLDEQGRSVSVVQQLRREFDDWSKTFLGGIQNQKASIYARTHVNSLWTSTYTRALAEEARIGVEVRDNQLDKSIASYAALAQRDDTTVEPSLQAVKAAIANVGYDVAKRDAKALAAQKTIVEAAVQGAIQRNPSLARDALEARFRTLSAQPAIDGAKLPAPAPSGDQAALIDTATRLGISPVDLATVIHYETGGTFNPATRGGAEGRHVGLIQFGPAEQQRFGASQQQSFAEQLPAVERYLKERGVRPGDDLETIYRVVNGGNRAAPLTASDGNGTIAQHVERMQGATRAAAATWLQGGGADGQAVSASRVPAQLAGLVDRLQADRVVPLLHAALTEDHRQAATFRTQLSQTIDDHQTQALAGQPPQRPLGAAQFDRAFGPEGPARFEAYQQNLQVGQDIAALQTATPAAIAQTLSANQPVADTPGYALQARRYAAMAEAANKIAAARQADPIHAAIAARIGDAKPIDVSSAQTLAASLRARDGLALTMSESYGTPFRLLTKVEAEALASSFGTMSSEQKLAYLDTIRRALPEPRSFRSVVQQIAADSPVTAVAGEILVAPGQAVGRRIMSADVIYAPRDVAARLLEGEALLNPPKSARGEDGRGRVFPMPLEKDLQDKFASEVGGAFAGDPMGAHYAYQAVKAWYAGEAARTGDLKGALDSGRFSAAVEAVLGGVTSVNGRTEVLRPWGMSEAAFLDGARRRFDAAIAANGYAGTLLDNWNAYGLQPGGGRDKYLVASGSGYLVGRDGQPIVLDLSQGLDMSRAIPLGPEPPPTGPSGYVAPGAQRPERVEPPATRKQATR